MALVRDIDVRWDASGSMHPTEVDAVIKVVMGHGTDPLVQIDTFGSQARKLEGKMSQTLQFDRKSAEVLIAVLKKAYRL
jgi:hypothetical protein